MPIVNDYGASLGPLMGMVGAQAGYGGEFVPNLAQYYQRERMQRRDIFADQVAQAQRIAAQQQQQAASQQFEAQQRQVRHRQALQQEYMGGLQRDYFQQQQQRQQAQRDQQLQQYEERRDKQLHGNRLQYQEHGLAARQKLEAEQFQRELDYRDEVDWNRQVNQVGGRLDPKSQKELGGIRDEMMRLEKNKDSLRPHQYYQQRKQIRDRGRHVLQNGVKQPTVAERITEVKQGMAESEGITLDEWNRRYPGPWNVNDKGGLERPRGYERPEQPDHLKVTGEMMKQVNSLLAIKDTDPLSGDSRPRYTFDQAWELVSKRYEHAMRMSGAEGNQQGAPGTDPRRFQQPGTPGSRQGPPQPWMPGQPPAGRQSPAISGSGMQPPHSQSPPGSGMLGDSFEEQQYVSQRLNQMAAEGIPASAETVQQLRQQFLQQQFDPNFAESMPLDAVPSGQAATQPVAAIVQQMHPTARPAGQRIADRLAGQPDAEKWLTEIGNMPSDALKIIASLPEPSQSVSQEQIEDVLNQHRTEIANIPNLTPTDRLYWTASLVRDLKYGIVPFAKLPSAGKRLQLWMDKLGTSPALTGNPQIPAGVESMISRTIGKDRPMPTPKTKAEYDALPPGTPYIDIKDGKRYVK